MTVHTDYEKSYLTVYDYNNNKSWKQLMNKKPAEQQ